MMKKLWIILGFAALASCKPDLKTEVPQANGLDFSRYLAIGNSLTAGYADGTLYRSGQQNSYPAMLAGQFSYFGPFEFRQPLLKSEAGFPGPKKVLGYAADCKGINSLTPLDYTGPADTTGDYANISAQGPFNNMGIPYMRAIDYLRPYYAVLASGLGIPYAARMFSDPAATPLTEALKINPTFFTLWLGSNDILGYALSGGEGNINPDFPQNLSDPAVFRVVYDSVVKALVSTGAKGVLMNIPDITSIPFFTTVPYNGLTLDTASAAQLNTAFGSLGMQFRTGANNFVIQDLALPSGRRQIKKGELILLSVPQDSIKCGGWGSTTPIPKEYVLTSDEVSKIINITRVFNGYIKDASVLHSLPMADMNAYMQTLQSGIVFNGVDFNTQFITGGAFSLDGIHLTPRGYALVANKIIETINAYYKSTVPRVDVNKYSGVKFP